MSLILLVAGVVLAAVGAASVGFAIPINELALGSTMIVAGAVALVGGLLLIGMSAVVAELVRVTAALKAGPAVHRQARPAEAPASIAPVAEPVARESARETTPPAEPPAAPIPAPPVPAPAAAAVEVSASAIERLRSSIPRPDKGMPEAEEAVPLSPNGQYAPQQPQPANIHPEPPPMAEPATRAGGAAAVEAREPRLDFLFRPRPTRPAPQQEAFDSLWPKRPARDSQPDPRLEVARAPANGSQPSAAAMEAPAHEPPAPSPQRTVAILKSGVVDGMAYTLYADGSIEAQLPRGTVRFGSIAELRAHIESNA